MDNLVKNNTGSLKNGRPPDCINIEEPDRELGTEDLNEPEIDMIEYGSWIIDNVEDSGDSSPNFPSLSANGSSVVTSELDMLVSSPQLDFGDLLCTEVLEAVEG
ncbi:Fc.00g093720.m01.CDS01 [Cosmosporella sp. VM-42]